MDKGLQHTGDNDLTHSMAHYLLAIHKLKEMKGYARVTDVAKDLGITKGSVSLALNNLKKRGLVVEDDSKFLDLSQEGHLEVHEILSSRTLLYYFFKDILGVSEELALKDACLMEHLLGKESRHKFFHFLKKITDPSKDSSYKAKTNLNLQKYKTSEEFIDQQKGDCLL